MNDLESRNAVKQTEADEQQRKSWQKYRGKYASPSFQKNHEEKNVQKQDLRGYQILHNWFSKSGDEKRHERHEKSLYSKYLNNYRRWRHLDGFNELLNDPAFIHTVFLIFWIVCTILFFLIEYALSNIESALYDTPKKYTFLQTLNPFYCWGLKLFYICVMAVATAVIRTRIYFRVRSLNTGSEGTARWAYEDEIDRDYKLVDVRETFDGCGGIPIYWKNDHQVYIDNDKAKHTLIVGKTASGKTQTQIEPAIHLFALAKEKTSMLINDAKLELSTAFAPYLKSQGYKVILVNLIDTMYSSGFNPLAIVVQLYRQGEEENIPELQENARNFALKFCFSIFHPDEPCGSGNEKYFKDTSTAILSALIMAQTKDAIEADRQLNRDRKIKFDLDQKRKKENEIQKLGEKEVWTYRVQEYYRKQRVFCSPSRAEEKTVSQFLESLEEKDILTMIHAKPIHIEVQKDEFMEIHPNAERVTIYSIVRMITKLTGEKVSETKNMLDIYFDEREDGDVGKELYGVAQSASEKTKGNIYSTLHTDMQGFKYESIAKLTAKMDIDYTEIGFGRYPVAIFLGLPDYDHSNYFLATAFIDQLLYSMTYNAAHAPGATLPRRFAFILDEFGNMPPLNDFHHTITVARSRNICLIMAIQAFSQLDELYGKEQSVTIMGNCANTIYIKSADNESNEKISKLLGNKTVIIRNRTGSSAPFSMKSEDTEMAKGRPLLTPDECGRLVFGEQIVYRVDTKAAPPSKRGKKQLNRPYPILCTYDTVTGENHMMRPAFQYLSGIMPKKGQMLYASRVTEMLYRRLHNEREELIRENHEAYLRKKAAEGKRIPPETVLPHLPLHPDVVPGMEIPKLQRLDLSNFLYPANEWVRMYNMTYGEYRESCGENNYLITRIMKSGKVSGSQEERNAQIAAFPIRFILQGIHHDLSSPQDSIFEQAFSVMQNLMPTTMNVESGNRRTWHFLKNYITAKPEDLNITAASQNTAKETPEKAWQQQEKEAAGTGHLSGEKPQNIQSEAPPVTHLGPSRRSVRSRRIRH